MIALNVVSIVDINIENDLNNLENYIVSYNELLIMVAVIPHRFQKCLSSASCSRY